VGKVRRLRALFAGAILAAASAQSAATCGTVVATVTLAT